VFATMTERGMRMKRPRPAQRGDPTALTYKNPTQNARKEREPPLSQHALRQRRAHRQRAVRGHTDALKRGMAAENAEVAAVVHDELDHAATVWTAQADQHRRFASLQAS